MRHRGARAGPVQNDCGGGKEDRVGPRWGPFVGSRSAGPARFTRSERLPMPHPVGPTAPPAFRGSGSSPAFSQTPPLNRHATVGPAISSVAAAFTILQAGWRGFPFESVLGTHGRLPAPTACCRTTRISRRRALAKSAFRHGVLLGAVRCRTPAKISLEMDDDGVSAGNGWIRPGGLAAGVFSLERQRNPAQRLVPRGCEEGLLCRGFLRLDPADAALPSRVDAFFFLRSNLVIDGNSNLGGCRGSDDVPRKKPYWCWVALLGDEAFFPFFF